MPIITEIQVGTTTYTIGSSLPSGGTTNQFLIKNSNVDNDVSWSTAVIPTISVSSETLIINF